MLTKFRCLILFFISVFLFTQCRSIDEALAPRNPDYNKSRTSKTETIDFDEPGTETATAEDRPATSSPGASGETALQLQVVAYAKKFIGTKYKYGGKSPSSGFDCSGFTRYVMDNFDVALPPVSRYQEQEGKRISLKEAAPGDLVFFRRSKRGNVFHVALVAENSSAGLKVVHSTNRGVVLDNITNNSYWAPKLSSARRVLK
ncbi:MAG: C40 family peptidase [Bacteroidota bacterium]